MQSSNTAQCYTPTTAFTLYFPLWSLIHNQIVKKKNLKISLSLSPLSLSLSLSLSPSLSLSLSLSLPPPPNQSIYTYNVYLNMQWLSVCSTCSVLVLNRWSRWERGKSKPCSVMPHFQWTIKKPICSRECTFIFYLNTLCIGSSSQICDLSS